MGLKDGTKSGGRKAGTPNKKTRNIEEKAKELGVDPFEILLLYAKRDWSALGYASPTIKKKTKDGEIIEVDVISPELQANCASDACQYLYPKRKAIEIESMPEEAPKVFILKWADEATEDDTSSS